MTLTLRTYKAATLRIIHDISNPKLNFYSVYVWHCLNKHISCITRIVYIKTREEHEGQCCYLNQHEGRCYCLNKISRIFATIQFLFFACSILLTTIHYVDLLSKKKLGIELYSLWIARFNFSIEMQWWPSFNIYIQIQHSISY